MTTPLRGLEREYSLPREAYYTDGYFALTQLCSMSQQIHEIHSLRPQSILEIGIGNGFTSTFLKRAGYAVTTADINPALEPDICAPLDKIESQLVGRTFDLVVCCEVLEHMPLDTLESNLDSLRALGRRLFMTLPNYRATIGLGALLRLPRVPAKLLDLHVEVPRKKRLEAEHFWEVGSHPETSKGAIMNQLRSRYSRVSMKRLGLNPYHIAFYGS